VETAWNNEWARFCHPVYELAEAYDPQGVAGLEADLAGHAPGNLRCASFNDGTLVGMPFSSFQGQMYIRQDLIDDPTEKAAFKARYGYDLGVPTTQAEQSDLGEFFTRGEGELLKGEPLDHDFYGLAIMAGAYQLNDVVCCRIWPEGSDYASPVRDANGKLTEFVITKKDKAAIQTALTDIKNQVAYCSPGSYTADFDGPPQQMSMGLTACVCETYAPLDQWGFQVEQNVPGAKMAIYMTVGNQPYTGCYSMNVQKTSKNPEAAYWLQRYIGCYEVQKEMSEGGWQGVRMDVYADPKYQTEEWRTVIGARAKYCNDVWAATGKYINDYFFFNSDVAGAIYDMQILVLNRAITGELSVADTVSSLNQQTMELQRKFGSLPIREET